MGDGDLSTLAFATLPSGDDGYVLDWDLNISYLSTGRDLLHFGRQCGMRGCKERFTQNAAQQPSLIIANPDFNVTTFEADCLPSAHKPCSWRGAGALKRDVIFGPLPGTRDEAHRIARVLSSHRWPFT